jgi:hypothetical protein
MPGMQVGLEGYAEVIDQFVLLVRGVVDFNQFQIVVADIDPDGGRFFEGYGVFQTAADAGGDRWGGRCFDPIRCVTLVANQVQKFLGRGNFVLLGQIDAPNLSTAITLTSII